MLPTETPSRRSPKHCKKVQKQNRHVPTRKTVCIRRYTWIKAGHFLIACCVRPFLRVICQELILPISGSPQRKELLGNRTRTFTLANVLRTKERKQANVSDVVQSPTDDVASVSCAVSWPPCLGCHGPMKMASPSLLPEPQRQLLSRHAHLSTTHRNLGSPCRQLRGHARLFASHIQSLKAAPLILPTPPGQLVPSLLTQLPLMGIFAKSITHRHPGSWAAQTQHGARNPRSGCHSDFATPCFLLNKTPFHGG